MPSRKPGPEVKQKNTRQADKTYELRIYHRLASAQVAEVLESLSHLSPTDHLSRLRSHGSQNQQEFLARSCYNHIAGRLGVLLCERLLSNSVLTLNFGTLSLGPNCSEFCQSVGLGFTPAKNSSRPQVKACLDWSERQMHVSGPFGTALMSHFLQSGHLERESRSRALLLTPKGADFIDKALKITSDDLLQVALSPA